MVCATEVELGEHLGLTEWLKGGVDEGKRRLVFDSDVIEAPEVNARLEGGVFLLDKEKASTKRG